MLNAMSVMGVPYKDLMLYQASAGERYKPLAGVSGKPIYNIEITDYNDDDYDRTANTFRVHFTRKFAGTEDISLADATTMESALASLGVENAEQLDGSLMMGGNTMADIELRLATTYGHESSRVRIAALNKLTTYIETASDFKAFKESEKNGNASRLISESINEHGVLTEEYINMILGNDAELPEGKKTEGGSSGSNESLNISGQMDGQADPFEEISGTIPTASKANDDLLNTGGGSQVSEVDEMINAVIANETGEDNSINLGTPNVSEVTERRINKVDEYREAASKITYEEYQGMSRSEAREAGLPATGFESAEAFGFFPKKYFKGGAEEIDLGIDKTSTDSSTVAGAAVKVANELADEFTDMSVFLEIDDRGRPDDTILKDWLDQNNVPANEQMIRMIRTMIKARQKKLKENPASELDE